MIYLFAGDDTKNKYKNYEKFIESLPKDIATFSIGKNNFNRIEIESFYSGAGLFFGKCVIFLENVFENKDNLDFILEKLDLISSSNNDFVFLEGKLSKIVLDSFKKVRAELNVFELPKDKKEKYDNFLLAYAFADRNKLELWTHFRRAMDKGVGMEELVGVLFWKIKDMLLKRNFTKFKEEELKNFANKLSYLLPEARGSGKDAEAAFEQFILEAF